MQTKRTLQTANVTICMVAIGFLIGFLYEELWVQKASMWYWAGGMISLIGWCHLFWMAAFRPLRTKKRRK